MNETRPPSPSPSPAAPATKTSSAALADHIGNKASRKLRARRSKTNTVWFGLGMMGLVGWSVVVPTMLGGALGLWIDKHHHQTYGLTLPMLMVGLAIGCINAWHWVAKQEAAIAAVNSDNSDVDGSDDQTGSAP